MSECCDIIIMLCYNVDSYTNGQGPSIYITAVIYL